MSEERARERLAYEVGLARNQLAGEQREREAAERRLTSETEELKRRCQHAERYKQDRDEERKGRAGRQFNSITIIWANFLDSF